MKATSISFFVLASLLFFMSCSAGKKSVNLKVSTSFALGANGYTGGLVVSGQSSDGKSFTATTVGGKELQVALTNGTWSLHVTGWDGSTAFSGNTYCGHKTVVLDSNTTAIDITANEANCASSEFTEGKTNLVDATYGFREIIINTCANLTYKSGTEYHPLTSTTPTANLATGFCSGDLPQEFKKRAKALKIVVPGDGSELVSSCISMATGSTNTGLRFPAGKIPAKVQLFDQLNCSGEPLDFLFKKGLLAGSNDFDSVVNNQYTSASYALILPFNELRRGYSATMNLLPMMRCNYAHCLPEAIAPADYYFHPGLNYQKIKIDSACANLSYTIGNADELEVPSTNSCFEDDGEHFLSVRIKTNSYCMSTPCTITINGTNRTITQNQQDYGEPRNAYDSTWRLLGTNAVNSFYDIVLHDDNRDGKLGHAMEDMGPGGAVSLLGNITCAQIATSAKKEITLFDEGSYKTFQVQGSPSTKPIPSLLCDNEDANPGTCSATTFDTKITVRQLENQIWKAREVIHLNCNYKIGIYEDQGVKLDNGLIRTEKEIIGWNTQTPGFERFESFNYEVKKNAAGVISEASTSFSRGQIIANDFQAQIFEWRTSRQNGTDYFENLNQKDVYRSGTNFTFRQQRFSGTSNVPEKILSYPFYSQAYNTPSLSFDSFTAKSPNGTRQIRLWTEKLGGYYLVLMSERNGTNWSHPTDVSTDFISTPMVNAYSPRGAISDAGNIVLAWREHPNDHALITKTRSNGNWSTATSIPTPNIEPITGLDVCMDGTQAAITWDQLDSTLNKSRVYLSYTTNFVSGTWNHPSSDADSVSPDTNDYFKGKCAIVASLNKVVVAYRTASLQVLAATAFTNLTGATSWLAMRTTPTQISPSGVYGLEPFIEKDGTIVVVSYADNNLRRTFKNTYNGAWTFPTNAADGANVFMDQRMDMTMTIGENLSSFNTAGPTPLSVVFPAYNTILGLDNFNLRELKSDLMDAKFTPYANFVQQ